MERTFRSRVTRGVTVAVWILALGACGGKSGSGDGDGSMNNTTAVCGNGILEGSEQCDEGENNSDTTPDSCRSDCRDWRCGDGVIDSGETCDDGYANSDVVPDVCRTDCLPARCGDKVVDVLLGETCDCGNDPADLARNCTLPNGHPDGPCAAECRVRYCGNGVREDDEVCDDGNNESGDGCSANCMSDETCGNGELDTVRGETCDDGNLASHDGCSSACGTETFKWRPARTLSAGRQDHMMAYMGLTGRVTIFGDRSVVQAGTWEYDGQGWVEIDTAFSPADRRSGGMAYDAGRQRMVLFGGLLGFSRLFDTWEYDGVNWEFVPTPTAPPARHYTAMVYDESRGRIVVFGGSTNNGFSNDTWEYDGADWVEVTGSMMLPLARYGHAMAYDSQRQVTVMYGGCENAFLGTCNSWLGDTWEYDGTDWTPRLIPTAPPARLGHAMAFDTARNVTVLYGGYGNAGTTSDTWEFNGSNWAEVTGAQQPGPRGGHGVAFDETIGRVTIFGGCTVYNEFGCATPEASTWQFDGAAWTLMNAAAEPQPRSFHASIYDAARGRMVMAGGWVNDVELSDTWEYDGRYWTYVNANPPLPAVAGHGLVYDENRQVTLLYGGCTDVQTGFFSACNDATDMTMEYDGIGWNPVYPAESPPARAFHAMTFDATRNRVVMFGGITTDSSILGDTWEYDGSTWQQITTPDTPPFRFLHAMTYDAARGRTVMFGGAQLFALAETWEYDGVNWTRNYPPTSPAPRAGMNLTYDPVRQRVILFGGCYDLRVINGTCPIQLDDTWEYNGTDWIPIGLAQWPPARWGHTIVYHTLRRGVFLFGGADESDLHQEAWRYRGESTLPDERCDNGADDDQDGEIDCADVDCEGLPCPGGTCAGGTCQ